MDNKNYQNSQSTLEPQTRIKIDNVVRIVLHTVEIFESKTSTYMAWFDTAFYPNSNSKIVSKFCLELFQ